MNPTDQLVALRVAIGLREPTSAKPGRHDWPDFDQIPAAARGGMHWSNWVSMFPALHYDRQCGHFQADSESPFGTWCCMMLVNEDFAEHALRLFPDKVTQMTETEAERFYEDRAHAKDPEAKYDRAVVDGIRAKQEAGIALNPTDLKALDEDDPTPGIVKDNRKKWNGFKSHHGISKRMKKPEGRDE